MATLKYAITNVARVGATPVGYVPRRPFVYVNGTDRSAWVLTSSLNINQQLDDMADTCDFLMRVPVSGGTAPAVGQSVSVQYGTTANVEFTGTILSVEAMPRRAGSRYVRYRVSGVDRTWAMGRRALMTYAQGADPWALDWPNTNFGSALWGYTYLTSVAATTSSVVADAAITSSLAGNSLTMTRVAHQPLSVDFHAEGTDTPASAIKRAAELMGMRWDVSPAGDIILNTEGSRPVGAIIDNSTALVYGVRYRTDGSQMRTRAVIACGKSQRIAGTSSIGPNTFALYLDDFTPWQGFPLEAGELVLAVDRQQWYEQEDAPRDYAAKIYSVNPSSACIIAVNSGGGGSDSPWSSIYGSPAFVRPVYLRVNSTAAAAMNSLIGTPYVDWIVDNEALTVGGARLMAKAELAMRATAETQLDFESIDLDTRAGTLVVSSLTQPITMTGTYLAQSVAVQFRSRGYPKRTVSAGGYKRDLYTLIKQLDAGLR